MKLNDDKFIYDFSFSFMVRRPHAAPVGKYESDNICIMQQNCVKTKTLSVDYCCDW